MLTTNDPKELSGFRDLSDNAESNFNNGRVDADFRNWGRDGIVNDSDEEVEEPEWDNQDNERWD